MGGSRQLGPLRFRSINGPANRSDHCLSLLDFKRGHALIGAVLADQRESYANRAVVLQNRQSQLTSASVVADSRLILEGRRHACASASPTGAGQFWHGLRFNYD